MFSQRNLAFAVFALLAVGLIYLAVRPDPIPVEVATVTRGALRAAIHEEGETRVRDRFTIAAPVSGRLQRVDLDAGDPVRSGQVLAEIVPQALDPRFLAEARARREGAVAELNAAAARVEQAAAALAQARRSANRARQLARDKTISKYELEMATLEETTHEKELTTARFVARTVEYNLAATEAALLATSGDGDGSARVPLLSPVDGAVLRLLEKSERVLSVGTPVIEIGDPTQLEIVIDVLSSDAVRVQPGAAVIIEKWGGERVLHARVRRIEPAAFKKISALGVEEQRVNIIVDFEEPHADLGDAFRIEAQIVTWEKDDALRVPAAALFRGQGEWQVFVVADDRAIVRTVQIGQRTPLAAEVLDGLAEGETVIAYPSDLVRDGVAVKVSDRRSATQP